MLVVPTSHGAPILTDTFSDAHHCSRASLQAVLKAYGRGALTDYKSLCEALEAVVGACQPVDGTAMDSSAMDKAFLVTIKRADELLRCVLADAEGVWF